MSLLEKLKSKTRKIKQVVVDGDTYEVRGVDLATKARVYAKARRTDGTLDTAAVDSSFLAICVFDPETEKQVADATTWKTVPGHITGPLLDVIADVAGMKTEGAIDPKDLDSIES